MVDEYNSNTSITITIKYKKNIFTSHQTKIKDYESLSLKIKKKKERIIQQNDVLI
jgi:hypothetical protein